MNALLKIRCNLWIPAGVLALAILLCPYSPAASAAENKINLNEVVEETQKTSPVADVMNLLWWIPEEFWLESFKEDESMTPAEIEEFVGTLRPYTLVMAVDGKMGTFGGVTYKTEEQIRSMIRLKDDHGNVYEPIPSADVDPDVVNLLAMMKPMFENIIGAMGKNMHAYVFPGKTKDGKPMADPKQKGSFTVVMGGEDYKWKLPLGSLLPKRVCPTCKEKLSGAYNYCPWDGAKLPEPSK